MANEEWDYVTETKKRKRDENEDVGNEHEDLSHEDTYSRRRQDRLEIPQYPGSRALKDFPCPEGFPGPTNLTLAKF